MSRFRLGVRSRLLLAVAGAVTLALALGVAAFNVLLEQRLSSSATSLARAEAEAEAASLEIRNGQLVAPEGPDEGGVSSQVWVFAGARALEAPSAAAGLDRAARSLASEAKRSRDLGEETRLYAVPVIQGGKRFGTVVSAVALDPYEETASAALVGSLILAGLLLAAIVLLSRWMLGRAFRPVSRMTEDAASWSEHDLDRRFALGEPYDELTRLGATLDAMLGRIGASRRHEQRFTAELSHELRTPLARISGEAELMLARERTNADYRSALEAVRSSAEQMTRTVDALLAAARQEAGLSPAASDARVAVKEAVDGARATSGDIELVLSLPAEPVRVAVDEELVERIVQPLIDNAVRYGDARVRVSLVRDGNVALVEVADDGRGVDEHERVHIFEPGARGTAAAGSKNGAGLGLSLARRLARSAGGDIVVAPSTAGGRFILRFPLDG